MLLGFNVSFNLFNTIPSRNGIVTVDQNEPILCVSVSVCKKNLVPVLALIYSLNFSEIVGKGLAARNWVTLS